MTPRPVPAPVSDTTAAVMSQTPQQIVGLLVTDEARFTAGAGWPIHPARIRLDAVHVGCRVVTANVMAESHDRARLYAEAVTILDGPDGIARVQTILRDIADAADREARA